MINNNIHQLIIIRSIGFVQQESSNRGHFEKEKEGNVWFPQVQLKKKFSNQYKHCFVYRIHKWHWSCYCC